MEIEKRPGNPAEAAAAMAAKAPVIGPEQLKKFMSILEEYKAGKTQTESRIVASENWWKLRNSTEEQRQTEIEKDGGYKSVSGWLHNVLVSKHADAMEAYPEPNILPRESGDRGEARMLSSIIPCILEQNHFEDTYSDVMWQKVKTGTGVYKAVWDKSKLNGLGDISVERANLLNLYWEPGVTDIQKSRYFFHTELNDKDVLEQKYPELAGKLKGQSFVSTKFLYDDHVPTENKHTVIDVYYHTYAQGRKILQYCKFVGDVVLYATENDPEMAMRGLYDHGLYPYVFDPLFPIEGSPCGYGYVDLCRNPQTTIDMLNTSFVKNAMVGATPRYFSRGEGSVNEQEFLDLSKPLVHVTTASEDSLRRIEHNNLDGVYVNVLDRTIQELRETSGNTETSTGNISSGVTAASAIAALQQASGKGSRDSTQSSYRAYSEIVNICIELIRQFYDMPRQFRILGQYGAEEYVTYINNGIQLQDQGAAFGDGGGFRLPVFDVKVSAQKKNVYTKVTQNELALQFFQLGFFNPQMTDQTLMCLDMMEFDGKDGIMQKVAQNGTMFQKLLQYMQLALTFAQQLDPMAAEQIAQDILMTTGGAGVPSGGAGLPQSRAMTGDRGGANTKMNNARATSDEASQPSGGRVTRKAGGK
ncbi:MAG: hypothetical protein ACI3XI_03935 [Eubacteriales bacterium]